MIDRTMLELLQKVATGLEELLDKMVFVGGAIVGLYADDPLAEPVRPTSDIDLSVSLSGYGEWSRMQERLSQLGFYPDQESHIICRYQFKGITVDIMPDDPAILKFTNKWYRPGIERSVITKLGPDLKIRVLQLPYFLATKFEAYKSRGTDARTSRDFEDIIFLTNNSLLLVEKVLSAEHDVKLYLQQEYRQLLKHQYRDEIILSHLEEDERLPVVLERMEAIVVGTQE